MCDGVKKIAKNSIFIICDSSMEVANEAHMGIPDIQYIASEYGNTVIATHMSDISREKLIKLNISNVIVPDDGYKINRQNLRKNYLLSIINLIPIINIVISLFSSLSLHFYDGILI